MLLPLYLFAYHVEECLVKVLYLSITLQVVCSGLALLDIECGAQLHH